MPLYGNVTDLSGIRSWEIKVDLDGEPAVIVEFFTGRHKSYVYTRKSCGLKFFYALLSLLQAGVGANSFINRQLKYRYTQKY